MPNHEENQQGRIVPLDSHPWECDMHPDERWPQKMNSCHWNPRPGYEQDPKKYGWVGEYA